MDPTTAQRRLDEIRDRLLERRGALLAENGFEEPLDESASELSIAASHPADTATDTLERGKAVSILGDVERQLEEVDHAFHRLTEGTYGVCESCGERIPDERLEAQPATRFCVADQERFERAARAPS